MRIDLVAPDPATYNKNPLKGTVKLKREALEQIAEAQKEGEGRYLKP